MKPHKANNLNSMIETTTQMHQVLPLIKTVLNSNVLGIYLYGSSIVGGLQKYSDLDLFVVRNRATTYSEKAQLTQGLLSISGIYMKSKELPIEFTIVEQAQVTP